jgi:Mrp family chromosome partitioning ATPase
MAAIVADAVSRRVRDPSELRDLLGTEWLGRLPAPARRDRRGPRLILPRDGSSRYGESVRLLRASLERATDLSARPTLAFTSPREREGRTTTVANVAYALASTGLRVVAVDLDLRRPMLHAAFDLPNDVGVVECLKGAGTETALQRVETQRPGVRNRPSGGGLWVLPAGSVPADPGGFLDSKELGGLLAGLRSWADVLVLDTGPLLGSADVIVLSRHVDAMVLLVSARRTTRSGALEAAAAAAQCACPVLGHVTCDDAPPLRRRSSTPQRTTAPPATRAGGEAPEAPRSVAPEGQAAP